jgi:hypothetical protein
MRQTSSSGIVRQPTLLRSPDTLSILNLGMVYAPIYLWWLGDSLWHLVGGWPTPLKNIWVRHLGWNIWTVRIQSCSDYSHMESHNPKVIHSCLDGLPVITYSKWWHLHWFSPPISSQKAARPFRTQPQKASMVPSGGSSTKVPAGAGPGRNTSTAGHRPGVRC